MDEAVQADIVTTPFEFSGSGGEYFRIWIVNLILTVLTLGIYSAWAKVRRNRYFYGHTRRGVAAFEYLAERIAILKGRLLALGVFLIYIWARRRCIRGPQRYSACCFCSRRRGLSSMALRSACAIPRFATCGSILWRIIARRCACLSGCLF